MQNLYTVLWQNLLPIYVPYCDYIDIMLSHTDILVFIYWYSPMSLKDLGINHMPLGWHN